MIKCVLAHNGVVDYPVCKVSTARRTKIKYLATKTFKDRLVPLKTVELLDGTDIPHINFVYQHPYEDINAYIAVSHGVIKHSTKGHEHEITVVLEQEGWVVVFHNLESLVEFLMTYRPQGLLYDTTILGHELVFTGVFDESEICVCSDENCGCNSSDSGVAAGIYK